MRIPILLTIGCLAALLLSCAKEGSVAYVNWKPVLDESSLGKDIPRPDSYHVRMTNIGTEQALEFDWSTSSPDAFRLVPGIYNVTVSAQGTTGGKASNYIGSVAGIELFDEFYTLQNGQPLSAEQRAFAEEVLESLKEGTV